MKNTANTVQWVLSKTISGLYCVLTVKIETFLKLLNNYTLALPFCREAKQGRGRLNNLLYVNKQISEANMNLIFTSELKPTKIFPSNLVDALSSPRKLASIKCKKHFPLVSETSKLFGTTRKIYYSSRFAQWEAKFNDMPVYQTSYLDISVFIPSYRKFCPFGCNSYFSSKLE